MKTKIISTISAIFFLAGIAYFAVGIYTENNRGVEKTKAKFDTFMLTTKNAALNDKIGTPEFAEDFFKAVGNFGDYSEIKLTIDDVLIYSYPPISYDFSDDKPSKKFVNTFSKSEFLNDILAVSGMTETNAELKLSASIYKIKQDTIHNSAKISFIFILIGTILSIIGLLISGEKDNAEKKEELDREVKADANLKVVNQVEETVSDETQAFDNIDNLINNAADDTTEIFDDDDDSEDSEPVSFEDSIIFSDEVESADDNNEITEISSLETTDSDDFEEPDDTFEEDFVDDESEIVDIHSEKTFISELGDQLKENKYNEVSLALIKITNFDFDDEKNQEKVKDIIALIKEREESETYKKDKNTLSIVLNGSDLESTISYCESILPAVNEIIGNSDDHKIHIGISAMNYRTIPADRLIIEADGALERAEKDPENPIVAFKANPERYKEQIGNELEQE